MPYASIEHFVVCMYVLC